MSQRVRKPVVYVVEYRFEGDDWDPCTPIIAYLFPVDAERAAEKRAATYPNTKYRATKYRATSRVERASRS